MKLRKQNPAVKSRTVIARTLHGESKESFILRRLGAGSLAHAVTMYKLGELELSEAWTKLESLAAREVEVRRSCNRLTRVFGKLKRALA